MEITKQFYPKLFFSLLFFAMIVISFLIIKPFLIAILTGCTVAVLSFPLYIFFLKRWKKRWLASLLTTSIVMVLILLPIIVLFSVLTQEAFSLYQAITQDSVEFGSNLEKAVCRTPDNFLCESLHSFLKLLPEPDINLYVNAILEKISFFITNSMEQIIIALPTFFLNLFVMLFILYYVLKDHQLVIERINSILPLKKEHKVHVIQKFKKVTYAVMYGNLAVATIQGCVAGIGYALLGVNSPLLWGALTILFSLFPYVGSAFVWIPLAFDFLIRGYLGEESALIVKGIVLLFYGFLIISTIDNILKPWIIGATGKVHPVLALLGVLGGLSLFGFVGLILGPALLALLMTFVQIYEEEKKSIEA